MAVRIVTDSASSLSEADRLRLNMTVVPLHISMADRPMSESELHDPGFYEVLASATVPLRTSQPSPEEFVQVFARLLAGGDDVLAVLISAGMSGTVRSAELAVEEIRSESPDARVEIVDTRSNSLEEGFAVLSAAEAAAAGASLEECRRAALETTRRTRFLFTPHSLEYLKRGGRISGAAALLGVALKIAPILTAKDGSAGVAGVGRNSRAARMRIAALMRADVERFGLVRAAVQYVADEEEAARFAADVVEPVTGGPVPIVPIHPVVGVHVGPAVGVVYETIEPLR